MISSVCFVHIFRLFFIFSIIVLVQQSRTTDNTVYKKTHECIVCMEEKSLENFTNIDEDSCEHIQRTVCNSCVYENTKVLIENAMVYLGDITCPEPNCHTVFSLQTIQLILVIIGKNRELFDRYDQQLISLRPNFVWCAYGCGSGQLHAISDPIVTCIKCSRSTCFNHRGIWHTDLTCDEYDLIEEQSTETDANNKWLELFAKKCPNCNWYIQKNEGCDHMTCRYCHHEFCWQCFADYQAIAAHGNSEHDIACTYYQI